MTLTLEREAEWIDLETKGEVPAYHWALKDTNKNGKPTLYLCIYDREATNRKIKEARQRFKAQGYSGKELAEMINNRVTRQYKYISCGQYGSHKSAEKIREAERKVRRMAEFENIQIQKTQNDEQELKETLQKLQLVAEVYQWRLNKLIEKKGWNKHKFIEEEKKKLKTGTEAGNEWRKKIKDLYRDYQKQKLKAIETNQKGIPYSEAIIQFNQNETNAFFKEMGH